MNNPSLKYILLESEALATVTHHYRFSMQMVSSTFLLPLVSRFACISLKKTGRKILLTNSFVSQTV